ncbi:MAG TPA: hypothetical protein PK109_02760 [Candidatus Paceibacterota bacterium]|nr:hypothetical protein [Candidatus Paceibacterota bacterium]
MPHKTIPILGFSCALLFAGYIVLVIATVFFATWETELASSASLTESRIAALETEYFDAIATLSETNVASAGYNHPERVEYVAANGKPTFTLAPTPATR